MGFCIEDKKIRTIRKCRVRAFWIKPYVKKTRVMALFGKIPEEPGLCSLSSRYALSRAAIPLGLTYRFDQISLSISNTTEHPYTYHTIGRAKCEQSVKVVQVWPDARVFRIGLS